MNFLTIVDLGVGKAPGGFPKVVDILQEELQKPLPSFNEKFSLLNHLNQQDFDEASPYHGIRTAHRGRITNSSHSIY